MTKHLRFLIVLLMTLVWSAGWAAVGDTFKLVTNANDLQDGDKIIIASKEAKVVLGTDNGRNKRKAVAATFSSDDVVEWVEGFDVITLEGSASAWYLHSETGYLYSKKNNAGKATTDLNINTTKSDANIASIKVDKNGATTISFINVTSDRGIYCNTATPSSLIFGYYQHSYSSKKPSQIYKLVNSDDKTSTTLSFDTTENVFKVFKGSESSFTAPKAIVKDAAGEVVAGAKITYESNAPAIVNVGENGTVTFGTEVGEATITANYAGDETHKPAKSIFYTITYSKVATEMAWSESSVSVNIGEVLSAPTLTLTANGENILAGKTIQYSSSNENVAMIDPETGDIVLMDKDGSTDITATFVGDDTYAEATAKYTLNVVDPNKTDVTFDFTKPSNFGYTDVKIVLNEGDKLTKDGFVLENVQAGKYTTRLHEGYLKIYASDKNHPAKGKISLSAPAGCVINRIVFTDDSGSPVSNLTFSIGEIDSNSKTWTGSAKALTMEVAQAQVFIQKMTIYFVKETETITLNETAINNTIVAKAGVNVTLKRTMAKGVWNTICLPFGLTSGQITTVFGVGVKVAQLDDTNSTGATLKFVDMIDAGIEASVPYLIKPVTDAPADGYKFVGVDITKDAVIPTKVRTAGNLYFNGVYNMVDATTEVASGYNAAFLGKGNTVFGAQSGTNMKGFRAYFAIPNSVKASELRVVIDGTATSIKNIDSEVVESNAPVYNLQGQRVDGNNLTPGIYVKAGKKFVVK